MPRFGKDSLKIRGQLHYDLQTLVDEAIKHIDFALICGFRGEAEQNKAYAEKKSTKRWPDSKHNLIPSIAVDLVPYHKTAPHIIWNDTRSFYLLAGYIFAVAKDLDIKVRWGGNWEGTPEYTYPTTLIDLPHWELVQE